LLGMPRKLRGWLFLVENGNFVDVIAFFLLLLFMLNKTSICLRARNLFTKRRAILAQFIGWLLRLLWLLWLLRWQWLLLWLVIIFWGLWTGCQRCFAEKDVSARNGTFARRQPASRGIDVVPMHLLQIWRNTVDGSFGWWSQFDRFI
jgi:hypothetical protein